MLKYEAEREARQRVSDGIIAALKPANLPQTQLNQIAAVSMGEARSVIIGSSLIPFLRRHQVLSPAGLHTGDPQDLESPGWRHIRRKTPDAAAWRVDTYYLFEPGLSFTYDVGGSLLLSAINEKGRYDYARWELRWRPQGEH